MKIYIDRSEVFFKKSAMAEEDETYSNVLVSRSSRQHRSLSCVKCQGLCALPSPWKVVVVILGSVCLVLLLTVGLLVKKLNEKSTPPEGYQRNISAYKKENKRVCDFTCSKEWHQHGRTCYYFSEILFPRDICDKFCTSLFSSFLKVITEEEMNFVMDLSKIYFRKEKAKFVTSLYYDNVQRKWVWGDGTDFTLAKFKISEHVNTTMCGYIINGTIRNEDCQSKGCCICKKLVHFP